MGEPLDDQILDWFSGHTCMSIIVIVLKCCLHVYRLHGASAVM